VLLFTLIHFKTTTMANAFTQKINHITLQTEVSTILDNEGPGAQYGYFMQIENSSAGNIILKGFFEIRRGNVKIYKSSSAISETNSGLITVTPPYLNGTIHIKNQDFNELLKSPDLELYPKRDNPTSDVEVIYYETSRTLFAGDKLFPSPPATGSFT
jgi:hypothetical protein